MGTIGSAQGVGLRRFAGKNEYYHSEKEPMRPGQQNRRSRNRGNRKGPNPLSRNYESNGPDVKIRGNAQHIADKYAQLARDATASGDRVMAENYLQHAEHYNRIIAAAQAQAGIQQTRDRDDDDADDDDIDTAVGAGNQGGNGESDGTGPQPVIDGVPAEVAYDEKQSRSSGDGDDEEERRPRRGRNRRPQQDNDAEASPQASADEDEAPSKPRKTRSSRARSNDDNGDDAAPAAEDGSAIGWLAAAGQD